MGPVTRKLFRGRLIFDFPSQTTVLEKVGRFAVVALSGATGVPEDDFVIEKVECRNDSMKTTVLLAIMADSEIEGWQKIAKLRKVVSDKGSPLNSVGHMKKVFTGAILHVFEPGASDNQRKENKSPVRYRNEAPTIPFVVPAAPIITFPPEPPGIAGGFKRRGPKIPPKHRLPPDAAHIPFDLQVVPAGVKSPPDTSDREMHYHLPERTRSKEEANPAKLIKGIEMKALVAILNSPKPTYPSSLMSLSRAHELKS